MASQIKKPSHPADSASPASSASARGSLKSAKAGILIPKYMDQLLLSEEDDNSTMQFRPSLSMTQKTKTPRQGSFLLAERTGKLWTFLTDVFAHIHVVMNLFQREGRPGYP